MLYWYEKACREAGMDEEKIREMRRGFDKDYKRLKSDKAARMEPGKAIILFSELEAEDGSGELYLIEDSSVNVEEEALHLSELKRLRRLLIDLPDDDRDFLLASFENRQDINKYLADRFGMTKAQVRYRKLKLVQKMQILMGYGL